MYLPRMTGVLAGVFSSLLVAARGDVAPGPSHSSETAGLLFTQTAHYANLTFLDPTSFTLTLEGVSPVLTWFTDRPQHKAGLVRTQQFFDVLFPTDYAFTNQSDAPNAALVGMRDGMDEQESLVVTLLNAKYEVDGLVHRVTYQARLLYDTPAASELPEDQEGWSIESNVTTSGGVRSMSIDKEDTPQDMGLSNVALFIDQIYCLSSMISCPWIGWGGIIPFGIYHPYYFTPQPQQTPEPTKKPTPPSPSPPPSPPPKDDRIKDVPWTMPFIERTE